VDVFFTLRQDDAVGALATVRFIKPFLGLRQFSVVNGSGGFGLMRRFRAEAMRNGGGGGGEEKGVLEN
jgi:hypothetical protein